MNRPDISICMITYKQEAYIGQAIESILSQRTSFTYQLVIGEDCSPDATRSICEQYAAQYPDKIILLPSRQNLGVVPNFMRTLDACTGKYIALCEGDDYWIAADKLQLQVEFLNAHPEYVLVAGRSAYLDYKGNTTVRDERINPQQTDFSAADYLLKMFFETATIVYRNDPAFRLPASYKNVFSADQYLVLLLTMNGGKIKYLDKDLAVYRYHAGGITKQTNRQTVLKRLFEMLDMFNEVSGGRFAPLIEQRKKITLLSWNRHLMKYPAKTFFILNNIGAAIKYRKYIPFGFKTFIQYLLP